MPVNSSNQGLLNQFNSLGCLNCNVAEKEKIIRELINSADQEELITTLTYHFHLLSRLNQQNKHRLSCTYPPAGCQLTGRVCG
ncbi:TPA: hypothetical protein I7721_02825 [Vibrio vulnificus]|nr:hypothetical protein [Vibrio vulnificus]